MGKSIKKHITDLLKDESGQGTTEYILVLVVVIALVFAFRGPIETAIKDKTGNLGALIQNFMP